jgi:Mg-chelatase subunit ChlD
MFKPSYAPLSFFNNNSHFCLHQCNCNKNFTEKKFENLSDIKPVESNDKFKIVLVLDESGSMESLKSNMLESMNDLIKEQKQVKGRPATFTLIKFSDNVVTVRENDAVENINLLSTEDYQPNGSTALYDAIGFAVNRFHNERDVLLVIVTDGHENASKKFDKNYVTKKLDEKKKYANWSYVYLSCDLSTFKQGENIGFSKSAACSNVRIDKSGYKDFVNYQLNSAIKNCRQTGISVQAQLNSQY